MVIWHNLLFVVNVVSKTLQTADVHINVSMDQLKGLNFFFERYRETGFQENMTEAKGVVTATGIELVFREKRIIRRKKKKKQFDGNVSEKAM